MTSGFNSFLTILVQSLTPLQPHLKMADDDLEQVRSSSPIHLIGRTQTDKLLNGADQKSTS